MLLTAVLKLKLIQGYGSGRIRQRTMHNNDDRQLSYLPCSFRHTVTCMCFFFSFGGGGGRSGDFGGLMGTLGLLYISVTTAILLSRN